VNALDSASRLPKTIDRIPSVVGVLRIDKVYYQIGLTIVTQHADAAPSHHDRAIEHNRRSQTTRNPPMRAANAANSARIIAPSRKSNQGSHARSISAVRQASRPATTTNTRSPRRRGGSRLDWLNHSGWLSNRSIAGPSATCRHFDARHAPRRYN
ncbi:MAG TPA: hypothetical protein VIA18_23755, partial [Polyangia bacterium]|nr:hypothetical protein [Polyangia bacterium]